MLVECRSAALPTQLHPYAPQNYFKETEEEGGEGVQRVGRGEGRRSEVMEQELGFLHCFAGPTFFILCDVL